MQHLKIEAHNQASLTHLPKSDSAWVLTRIELLMAGYRKADYHNPEGAIATLGTILEQYPPEVVDYVTDPRTGVQRKCKWPPSPAEVVEACEEVASSFEKRARYSALYPVRQDGTARHPARLLVRKDIPQYPVMVERSQTATPNEFYHDPDERGLWVVLGWVDTAKGYLRRFKSDDFPAKEIEGQ